MRIYTINPLIHNLKVVMITHTTDDGQTDSSPKCFA